MATTSETVEKTSAEDVSGPEQVEESTAEQATEPVKTTRPKSKATAAASAPPAAGITVSPLAMGLAAVVVVLAVIATALGFMWSSASSERDDARAELAAVNTTADENKRAEDVASKYAIGAATVDYQNLAPWRTALGANTTPQLSNDLQASATELEQVFVPMQWQSTATPLGSVVVSNNDGIIRANVFVNVITKSTQRPQGIPSVATYAVTVDTKQNWVITDVSGIDKALAGK
jgi:Mce-associated membrane protein